MFKTTAKFLIAFVRLILGKAGADGVTGRQREIDIRYEFDFKVVLKGLEYKWRFLHPFLMELPSKN